MTKLTGTRILVVGGSSGIGLAVARQAIDDGGSVLIASRSDDRLAAAAAVLGDCETLRLDIADEQQAWEALNDAQTFDHIVVSAGGVTPSVVANRPTTAAVRGFETKFWGAYRVAAFARRAERGSLTLISGVYADRPAAGSVAASCVNAAIEALARGLALEFAPFRVNAVSPGLVDTPLWSTMSAERKEAFFAQAEKSLPSRHVATPDDIAALVLVCMTNPTLTGSVIVADGGHVLI